MTLILIVILIVGTIIGSFVNWGIYSLAVFNPRPISPWARVPENIPARSWRDRIPIIGWIFLSRESEMHGKLFWARPLLLEVACGIGFAWLYSFHMNEFDPALIPKVIPRLIATPVELHVWYLWQVFLIAMMLVATFIDFDEQIIPDSITLPGTVVGLLLMLILPSAGLPGVVDAALSPIHLNSPAPFPVWAVSHWGLVAAIGALIVWGIALMDIHLWMFEFGIKRGFRFGMAKLIGAKRARPSKIERKPRKPNYLGISVPFIALIMIILVVVIWLQRFELPLHWQSFLSSILGMAVGGGIVWSIRIIGQLVLGKEAMGFGDVTLMAMIGSFVGWQAALLVFMFAPFAALVVIVCQFTMSLIKPAWHVEIAFGPYLCLSTLVILIFWKWIWNDWAAPRIFFGASLMVWFIPFFLVGAAVLLLLMRLTKAALGFKD